MLRLAFDFIITWRETRTRPNAYPGEAILQQMIRKNPVLETLIDTFDLKLISVQQGTPQPKVLPPKKRGFRL